MRVKEVTDLMGVSARTLHHYDEIGLLTPKETTSSGYRLYTEENIKTLQQILIFKELSLSLKEIRKIIYSPSFNHGEALLFQRKMLLEKQSNIDKMINTINKTIQYMSGEIKMTNEEKFEGLALAIKPMNKKLVNVGEMNLPIL